MDVSFFRTSRSQLARVILGPVVATSNDRLQAAGDAAYPFRQESNFWYLTGIDEPGWSLIMAGKKSWLIAPKVDDVHQVFDGSLSWDEAKKISGCDNILSSGEGEELMRQLSQKYSIVYTLGNDPRAKYYDFSLNPALMKLQRRLKRIFNQVKDCRSQLANLRAIKQPQEIEVIRQAVSISTEAFQAAKQQLSSYTHEYQIEADFSHYFRSRGIAGHAYDPIVASGKNACTLHYAKNSSKLPTNGLVLLDIGARLDGYAADITRTYALGRPTQRQIAVHGAVESAHQQIIALLRPGLKVQTYLRQVDQIMKDALGQLGLLKTPDDYRKYFPHAISHGLGIDVHDSLGQATTFQPGMVLTVEPGIYIPDEGIGVRIEDDILITKSGNQNLSGHLSTSL